MPEFLFSKVAGNLIKKEALKHVFSCEICKTFQYTFFLKTLLGYCFCMYQFINFLTMASKALTSHSKNTAKCKRNKGCKALVWFWDEKCDWIDLGAFSTNLGCIFIKYSSNIINVRGIILCSQFIRLRIHCKRDPVHTGRKLNLHMTFRKRLERLVNVLQTFSLRPVSTGDVYSEGCQTSKDWAFSKHDM